MVLYPTRREGKVAWVALNRPEKLNALNRELRSEIRQALESLSKDEDISVIVMHGVGRAFSVGQDLGTRMSDDERTRTYDDWQRLQGDNELWLQVWRCPKPVIAAVHGYVMGVAIGLTVCTDVTVIAEDAVVGWPGLPLCAGLLGPANIWLLGPKKAKELSLTWGRMSGA